MQHHPHVPMLVATNPATGHKIAEYPTLGADELEAKLAAAHAAFRGWRDTSFEHRAAIATRVAALFEERADECAETMTAEMGKPIAEAQAEVRKCARVFRYYADNGASFLSPEPVEMDRTHTAVRYDPTGAILAIMPWNFPFWQAARFAAPALMAGNVGLLKHAPNVPGCALAFEKLLFDAGVPPGAFQTLLIDTGPVEGILNDPRVHGVALTGSSSAGSAVGALAGKAIKRCVLELGGSDPFIVLADADVKASVDGAILGRFLNSGQSCIAAKRLIVVDALHDAFVDRLAERIRGLNVGDPTNDNTDVGPLARLDLRDTLDRQVRESIEAGADCVIGGTIPDRAGWFYPPTLLTNVVPGMPAFDEETFGPVACVVRARDAHQAIQLANQTHYGLGASVWTSTPDPGLAAHIDAGQVFFNEIVKSDPRIPFGGAKQSGIGRELGRHGILEFVNVKTVVVA